MAYHGHVCGFYYIIPHEHDNPYLASGPGRQYLPQVDLSVHTKIVSSTSRTTLTQNFVNPTSDKAIPELRYTFPLYDGVSVVGFTCTINKDRVIKGIVKERNEARKTYDDAVAKGETAGLLEQLPDASDVFTTTVGNVPGGAEIKVDITYLGELKHDAEVDGIRFTIPTSIAPRYGEYPGEIVKGSNVSANKGIKIVVDAEMPTGSNIKSIQSPSHPISVSLGNTSSGAASGTDMSLQKASATLSLSTAELDKDFVLQVVAADTGNPVAILETHPTIPNHRAIMTTLVPRFNLPSSSPEIVFVCDRSGSMDGGERVPHLKAALQIFLKSLPLGVKFNICSFGSHHKLLFTEGSVSYDASSVQKATEHVDKFEANFGGTEMYRPLEDVIKKRHKDMDLEIFLLTDGEVWDHNTLINLINKSVDEGKGSIRVFTLGIGNEVSHALIEGLARAGNGFSQTVMDNEKMNSKVLRMLKAALTPHIRDYTLEIKYEAVSGPETDDDDFEVIEKVMDALTVDTTPPASDEEGKTKKTIPEKIISLFNPAADPDAEIHDTTKDTTAGGKYTAVPPVSEPRILQAPFKIPALYPFNRTSVYLLLSPETTQQTPKSVVLRGTSAYGPLELEIPVTALTEKAETIHQLAARKAIRELEDGRGWIFHAKDTGDGKLLEDKYPGRFSDMVEREAVRLGVKFQVGGKWCSFVAVEDGSSPPPPAPVAVAPSAHTIRSHTFTQQAGLLGSAPPSYQQSPTLGMRYRAAGGHGILMGGSGSRAVPHVASLASYNGRGQGAPQSYGSLRSYAAPPPPAPMAVAWHRNGGQLDKDRNDRAFSSDTRAFDAGSDDRGGHAIECDEEELVGEATAHKGIALVDELLDGGTATPAASRRGTYDSLARRAVPKDPLETIVTLQTFDGYWKWSNELFAGLKIDGDLLSLQAQMSLAQDIEALGKGLDAQSDKLATAIVLAFLETQMKGRKDEWEMLAKKAYSWLALTPLSEEKARKYVAVVGSLIVGAYGSDMGEDS